MAPTKAELEAARDRLRVGAPQDAAIGETRVWVLPARTSYRAVVGATGGDDAPENVIRSGRQGSQTG